MWLEKYCHFLIMFMESYGTETTANPKPLLTSVRLLESLVHLCTPLAPDKVKWNFQAENVASTALLKCGS